MKRGVFETQAFIATIRSLHAQQDFAAARATARDKEDLVSRTKGLLETTILAADRDFDHARWADRHAAILRHRIEQQLTARADAQEHLDASRRVLTDAVRNETMWQQLGKEQQRKRHLARTRREYAALDSLALFRSFKEDAEQEPSSGS